MSDVVTVSSSPAGGYLVRGGHRSVAQFQTHEAALDEARDRLRVRLGEKSRYHVLRRPRRGGGPDFLVIGPDGHGVKCLSSLHLAEDAARRLNRESRAVERPCMCCGTTFLSEGKHNRLCGRCRHDSDFWGGV